MNHSWINNPARTETFVLNFKDQESFLKFWQQYIVDGNGLDEGVCYSSVSQGDRVKLLDKCQDCLSKAIDKITFTSCNQFLIDEMEELAES